MQHMTLQLRTQPGLRDRRSLSLSHARNAFVQLHTPPSSPCPAYPPLPHSALVPIRLLVIVPAKRVRAAAGSRFSSHSAKKRRKSEDAPAESFANMRMLCRAAAPVAQYTVLKVLLLFPKTNTCLRTLRPRDAYSHKH
ncbi:hypothetical protein DPSP01_007323 [Paraphaeosphaeria sporulosa]